MLHHINHLTRRAIAASAARRVIVGTVAPINNNVAWVDAMRLFDAEQALRSCNASMVWAKARALRTALNNDALRLL